MHREGVLRLAPHIGGQTVGGVLYLLKPADDVSFQHTDGHRS
ncbi:hypothetical protein [Streptomyces sp. NPDC001492]